MPMFMNNITDNEITMIIITNSKLNYVSLQRTAIAHSFISQNERKISMKITKISIQKPKLIKNNQNTQK